MTRFEKFLKQNPRTMIILLIVLFFPIFSYVTAQVMSDRMKLTVYDYEVNYYEDGTDLYVAEAYPGSTDASESYWRVYKIKDYESSTPCIRWANGSNEFRHVAEDYATFTYDDEI